jgi:cell division topological specificity factor
MGFLDYFKRSTKSASVAKDRLQIIVARERTVTRGAPDYLPQLQQELLQVIAKYELIDIGQVTVNVDKSGGYEVLELNVVLSPKPAPVVEPAKSAEAPAPA